MTAETKQPVTTTVTLPARDLLRGLHNASLFVSGDVFVPVLNAVWIETTKSAVTFSATDRYCIGVERVPVKASGSFEFLMDIRDVRLLAKLFTPKSADLTLTHDGTRLLVEPAADLIGTPAVTVTCTAVDGAFPKVRPILDGAASPKDKTEYAAGQTLGLNPRYMARFGRVKADATSPMKVRIMSRVSPVLVSIGDGFEGAIMPARLPDEATVSVRPKSSAA